MFFSHRTSSDVTRNLAVEEGVTNVSSLIFVSY